MSTVLPASLPARIVAAVLVGLPALPVAWHYGDPPRPRRPQYQAGEIRPLPGWLGEPLERRE